MANYVATARSNYFYVKDLEAFKAWAAGLGLEVSHQNEPYDPDTKQLIADISSPVALFVGGDSDNGGWPSERLDPNADDLVEVDITDELAAHLRDDQVAILMEVGAEKARYLVGTAYAVKSTGEILTISIDDIYDLVREKWGAETTPCET